MSVEFDGERYRAASAHQKEWGTRLIDELDLRGNEHILDVGCGDGSLTASLAETVPQGFVLGIDSSAGMIQSASSHERPNLAFRHLDVRASTYRDTFDIIFSNATLHWIKDHEQLLLILHRALKSGGVLRANFAGAGNCATLNRVAMALMTSAAFRAAFEGFEWPWYMPSVEAYRELATTSPFARVDIWGENADRYFADQDEMLKWVENPSIVPFQQHLDEETGERFHRAVADRMVEETIQSDGTCFEQFRRVNLIARKQPHVDSDG